MTDTPSPGPKEAIRFSGPPHEVAQQCMELADQLLICETMLEASYRRVLVRFLPLEIRRDINEDNTPRLHLFNIAEVCARHIGGLNELIDAVHRIEGDSIAWAALQEFLGPFRSGAGKVAPLLVDSPPLKAAPPPDPLTESVRRYLAALEKQFAVYRDIANIIPLSTKQGKIEPTKSLPPALQNHYQRAQTFLTPFYSPQAATLLQPDETRPEVSVEDFLAQNRRVALLGAPGAGKSTTLRRLVRLYAEPWLTNSELETPNSKLLPIFAALNRWQEPQMGLVEFLQEQVRGMGVAELAEQLPRLMAEGRVVLLLDGLNEVPQLERDEKTGLITDPRSKAIAALGERDEWREVRCLLTCRVKEFAGGPRWHDLHVLPLNREQVEAFARAYFEGDPDPNAQVQNLLTELYQSKNKNKAKLQGLTTQPFYLVRLLAYYYREGGLPDNPAGLVKYSIEDSLAREIELGNLTAQEAEELQIRLSYLAFNMTEAGEVSVNQAIAAGWLFYIRDEPSYDFESKKFKNKGEPKASLEDQRQAVTLCGLAERANLLILNGATVQFYHQLLQEYFCAYYCLKQGSLTLLKRQGLLFGNVFNGVWPLWDGLAKLAQQDLHGQLTVLLGDNFIGYQISNIFGQIGGADDVEPLVKLLQNENSTTRKYAANALGKIGDPSAVEPLIAALKDNVSDVRWWAASALGNIGDPRALPALEQLAKWAWLLGRIQDDRQSAKDAVEQIKERLRSQK